MDILHKDWVKPNPKELEILTLNENHTSVILIDGWYKVLLHMSGGSNFFVYNYRTSKPLYYWRYIVDQLNAY